VLVLASFSLLRITITITCRHVALQRTHDVSLTRPRCGCDDGKKERKKERNRFHGRSCAHSSSQMWRRHSGTAHKTHRQKKESDRPTDKSRAREGSPKTTVEESKTPGCQVLCLSIPFIPWGLRTSVSQGLAIHLCDSSIPSAFRRRLRRYVMVAYCSAAYGNGRRLPVSHRGAAQLRAACETGGRAIPAATYSCARIMEGPKRLPESHN
jgi:hypothetical protein